MANTCFNQLVVKGPRDLLVMLQEMVDRNLSGNGDADLWKAPVLDAMERCLPGSEVIVRARTVGNDYQQPHTPDPWFPSNTRVLVDDVSLTVSFETGWVPPVDFVTAFAAAFPEMAGAFYADEFSNDVCVRMIFAEGRVTSEVHAESVWYVETADEPDGSYVVEFDDGSWEVDNEPSSARQALTFLAASEDDEDLAEEAEERLAALSS